MCVLPAEVPHCEADTPLLLFSAQTPDSESVSTINLNSSHCKYNCTCAPNGLKNNTSFSKKGWEQGCWQIPPNKHGLKPNSSIAAYPFSLTWPEIPILKAHTLGEKPKEPLVAEVALVGGGGSKKRGISSSVLACLLGNWNPRPGEGLCSLPPFVALEGSRLGPDWGRKQKGQERQPCSVKSQAAWSPTTLFTGPGQ